VDDNGEGEVLGQLVPDEKLVVLNERHRTRLEQKDGRQRRYTIGHEVGHWTLHSEAARSGTLSLFDGQRILCREKSQHPVERQAQKFAAALLMPRDQLLPMLPPAPWQGWRHVYRLADDFVVTPTAMMVRLEELRWAHRDEDGSPASGPKVAAGQESLFS
jgi:Zn-dependent peptidase ImmA (M78 family)